MKEPVAIRNLIGPLVIRNPNEPVAIRTLNEPMAIRNLIEPVAIRNPCSECIILHTQVYCARSAGKHRGGQCRQRRTNPWKCTYYIITHVN